MSVAQWVSKAFGVPAYLALLGSLNGIVAINERMHEHMDAVREAFLELEGRNTIILITKAGTIIGARNGSPLVIGKSNQEIFLSSDTLSFAPYAKLVLVLDPLAIGEQSVKWLLEAKIKQSKNLLFGKIIRSLASLL